MNRRILLASAVLLGAQALAAGCKPAPPPAPVGLDESARYMIREFYRDDAFFGAGLQGFMTWYGEEGYLLVGEQATTENTDSFTVSDLEPGDIEHLALADLVPVRNVADAAGVVSLAEMDCSWKESEALLMRVDQDVVFEDNWEAYSREFQTSRAIYTEATASEEFVEIDVDLERFTEGFDMVPYESSVLLTRNFPDPASLLGINIPAYEMFLDFRHGIYDIDGTPTPVLTILTFTVDASFGESGENGLRQSFSIELNVAQENGKTLRMLAVWAEPVSDIADPDDAFVLNYAVNTSLRASERMTEVCTGAVTVPPESDAAAR